MTIEEMKARKRELGYTNERIAELSGVPLGTVQKVFSGETSAPRYSTVQKLEKALGESQKDRPYDVHFGYGERLMVTEASAYGADYYSRKSTKKRSVDCSGFGLRNVEKRIGVAAGKYKVPDESWFYDDEIAEMFEEV